MKKMNFIKTKDIETKDKLIECGYVLLSEENGVYTFLNCLDMTTFSQEDESKCVFTNMLNV